MLRLYHAPRTRSVRIRWLLEELGLPHELVRVPFRPAPGVFAQQTPLGKFPVLEDDGVVIGESGAILEYVLERHGGGRLAPPVDSPLRGPFLQWVHFAESTAFAPMGVVIWHTLYRGDADKVAPAMESAMTRARAALDTVEERVRSRTWILGDEFTGADVMLGFTLAAAEALGLLDASLPATAAYFDRLRARPAFARAAAD